ncbi:MAG: M28 family metallopeptidase [Candidatus Hermodarchaeota archaeon]
MSSKLYNEQAAINHVNTMAFNRHASTDGETKCINYITQELKKENINPTIEPFEWTKTFTIGMNLLFMFVFLYIFIYQIILLFPSITWSILPLNVAFFMFLFFYIKYLFDNTQTRFIGKKKEAKNLILTFRAKDIYPKRPVIIFTAHHDTASRRYPMKLSINLYKMGAMLLITFFILTFIISIWSLFSIFSITQNNRIYFFIRNSLNIIGFILIVLALVILGNKKSDKSIGSIDNASGIAVLLELAKLVKNEPLEKTDVIFIWLGAEERGLWGSKHYCKKHYEELNNDYDMNKSYNINIDMVGAYIGLLDKLGLFKKKDLNRNLNNVLEASATQQKITIKQEWVKFGAGSSDHVILRAYAKKYENKEFQVAFFSSDSDIKYIHSKRDTPDKCSAKNLNNCIEICYNAIKSLDLRVE